jgi:hypothetical protein
MQQHPEEESRNAALAERLASDPLFAEKWWACRREASPATWADSAADFWRQTRYEIESSAEETPNEIERLDLIRVVAQALAFRTATRADAEELTQAINLGYKNEQFTSNPHEGFRTEPLIDKETVASMVDDVDCRWILVLACAQIILPSMLDCSRTITKC